MVAALLDTRRRAKGNLARGAVLTSFARQARVRLLRVMHIEPL
jgi:hypothetical protein